VIFFDVDNTLIDYDISEHLAIRKLCDYYQILDSPDFDFVKLWQNISKQYYERYLAGEMTFQTQRLLRIKAFFTNIQTSVPEQSNLRNITTMQTEALEAIFSKYLEHFEESWSAYDDVILVLDTLKSHRLGIISNGETDQQIKKLACVGIQEYFEVIVTSHDIGVSKPDIEIFKKAANKAGVPVGSCTYIGDDLEKDAIAANKAGMDAYWLNRNNNLRACPGNIKMVGSLNDLAAALGTSVTRYRI
jgi:putative hydrolase of the HAD superfamily